MHETHEELLLASKPELSFAVLGKGEDFLLVSLANDIEHAKAAITDRGFQYCGTLAVKDGQPCAVVESCVVNPGAVYTMMFAGMAFARLVADHLKDRAKGDSTSWLEQLYKLQDARTDA